MFERMTDHARTVLALAAEESRRRNREYIETAHLLLALLGDADGCAAQLLGGFDINPASLSERVEQYLESGDHHVWRRRIPPTTSMQRILDHATHEAQSLNHPRAGTGHLLLGLLCERGVAQRVLEEAGLNHEAVRARLAEFTEADLTEGDGTRWPYLTGPSPSQQVSRVMAIAAREARRCGHPQLAPEHLLLAIMEEGTGLAAKILSDYGMGTDRLRSELEKTTVSGQASLAEGDPSLSPRAAKAIEYALDETCRADWGQVETEHLLFGILRAEEAMDSRILQGLGLELDAIRGRLARHQQALPTRLYRFCEPSQQDREYPGARRFTDRARKVMALANQEAQRFNHEYIGTEHILLGLVREAGGIGAMVLENLDVDVKKLRLEVEKLVESGPDMVAMGKLPQTPRAKKVVEYAIEEAQALHHNEVGTGHILLGLLRENEGIAAQVLMNLGLKLEDVRQEVLSLIGTGAGAEPDVISGVDTSQRAPAVQSQGTAAWRQADALAHAIYEFTADFSQDDSQDVAAHLRRAALLLPSNILEAHARRNRAEARWFVNIALGLLRELLYGLDFSARRGYSKPKQRLVDLADEIEIDLRRLHDTLAHP